jgi:hypothetical protein
MRSFKMFRLFTDNTTQEIFNQISCLDTTKLVRAKKNDSIVIPIYPQASPELNQDIVNQLAAVAPYKGALSLLSQTSKTMNELVENTVAGQMARTANNLNPAPTSAALAAFTYFKPPHTSVVIGGSIGLAGGTALAFGLACSGVVSNAVGASVGGFFITLGSTVFGSIAGCGLFQNKQAVENSLKEQSEIREKLSVVVTQSL